VMASDFAMDQFRFLKRLLLVHGHWNYQRVGYLVLYNFYRNVVFVLMLFCHKTLLEYPKLHGVGHRREAYNLQLFWITMIDTQWQSLESTIDIWSMGSLWTIAVVILVNIHLAMDIRRWVFITHAAVWGSIIITYACIVVLDSIPVFPNY
ncbi:hypothetical protein ES288_D08G151000v1, partial [Gossypium darwinii]